MNATNQKEQASATKNKVLERDKATLASVTKHVLRLTFPQTKNTVGHAATILKRKGDLWPQRSKLSESKRPDVPWRSIQANSAYQR